MRKNPFKRKEETPVIKPASLDAFPDFTKKEIFTQGELINELLERYIKADKISFDYLKIKIDKIKRIYVTGRGINYSCALFGAYNFEVLLDTVSVALPAGEFICSNPILDKNTLVVLVGEDSRVEKRTAISGARLVKIADYSDEKYAINLNFKTLGAFPSAEFTLKLTALALLALYLGEKGQVITALYVKIATEMIRTLPQKIKHILSKEFIINELCKSIDFDNAVFTGTNVDYAVSIYSSCILSQTSKTDITAMPLGELRPYQKESKSIIAFASNIDFYRLLDCNASYCLKIISGSVDIIDENALAYDESIPLLNPILSGVVTQLIAYNENKKAEQ